MIVLPALIGQVATRADGTLKITLDTNELSPEKMAALFGLKKAVCYVAIKPEDFGQAELEALEAAEAEMIDNPRKTYSKRLRDVMFRLWEANSEGFATFEPYYFAKMERIIAHYKGKLP